jgi:hypothetical protein
MECFMIGASVFSSVGGMESLNLWLHTDHKVSTPKFDTCFSLVTWEGVVQKFYRHGD